MRATSVILGLVLGLGAAGCGDPGKSPGSGLGTPPPAPPPVMGTTPRPGPVKVGDPLAETDAFIAAQKVNTSTDGWRVRLPPPAQVGFPADKSVYWTLETNKGRIVSKLWHQVAPLHVSNVVYLTKLGFYDGLTFHRVIKGFMAQGGCPRGNGMGMPGYGLPLEVRRDVKHDRPGLLSTAHSPAPNSDGSQFFITFRPTPELDMGYTLFGEVVEGLDVVRALEAVGATPRFQGDVDAPRERLVIQRASVEVR